MYVLASSYNAGDGGGKRFSGGTCPPSMYGLVVTMQAMEVERDSVVVPVHLHPDRPAKRELE